MKGDAVVFVFEDKRHRPFAFDLDKYIISFFGAATGWGWNQPYYGGSYAAGYGYDDAGYGYDDTGYGYGGGYGTGDYYGAYAVGGYPGYYGGYYANRSYLTGRPTPIPRYYGW